MFGCCILELLSVDIIEKWNLYNFRALYEEDILLFATLLCLNIEAEATENFSNEEMSLLLQGKYKTDHILQFKSRVSVTDI